MTRPYPKARRSLSLSRPDSAASLAEGRQPHCYARAMGLTILMGSFAHVCHVGIDVPWSPRWAAAATWAVVGMTVVALVIVGGVLPFLRPDGRSKRGFAEPEESAPRTPFPWPLAWRPDGGGQEGRAAADTSALMGHAAASTTDDERQDGPATPDAPEAPVAPDGF